MVRKKILLCISFWVPVFFVKDSFDKNDNQIITDFKHDIDVNDYRFNKSRWMYIDHNRNDSARISTYPKQHLEDIIE